MKSRRFRTFYGSANRAKAAERLGFAVGCARMFPAVPGTRDRKGTAAEALAVPLAARSEPWMIRGVLAIGRPRPVRSRALYAQRGSDPPDEHGGLITVLPARRDVHEELVDQVLAGLSADRCSRIAVAICVLPAASSGPRDRRLRNEPMAITRTIAVLVRDQVFAVRLAMGAKEPREGRGVLRAGPSPARRASCIRASCPRRGTFGPAWQKGLKVEVETPRLRAAGASRPVPLVTGFGRSYLAALLAAVTSPPYFGIRDYGVDQQIGLKGTPEE
jgi:hypothetical protein